MTPKFGVLEFRYDHFAVLRHRLEQEGSFRVNLGDNMQTIAVRHLYRALGIADQDTIGINRDALRHYAGPAAVLVMNGCFYEPCFPLPPQITPVFVGFNTQESVIKKFRALFKQHEPIGCRDVYTTGLFHRHGVRAYTSGCLTLVLPARRAQLTPKKVFIVHGESAGELPPALLSHVPPALLVGAEYVLQRLPMDVLPLGDAEVVRAESFALRLLERYAQEANLVITPLLHAASPCLALGIPVVLARKDHDARFTAIDRITPVYRPEHFHRIDWNPAPVDIVPIKASLLGLVGALLAMAPERKEHAAALGRVFDGRPGLI